MEFVGCTVHGNFIDVWNDISQQDQRLVFCGGCLEKRGNRFSTPNITEARIFLEDHFSEALPKDMSFKIRFERKNLGAVKTCIVRTEVLGAHRLQWE